MNKIKLSFHALKRMRERGIHVQWVQECIDSPDYIVSKGQKRESYKKIDGKILKVLYTQQDKFIKVITLMWK